MIIHIGQLESGKILQFIRDIIGTSKYNFEKMC